MIFVNVYEYSSSTQGDYILYRSYSGESEEEIKISIINDVGDSWDGNGDAVVDAFEALSPSLSFKEIAWRINEILNELVVGDYVHECHLVIGDPTSDISDVLDFYGEYREVEDIDVREDVYFYFYGDYAIKIQNMFPYFYDLSQEYGVSIGNATFHRLAKNLLNA